MKTRVGNYVRVCLAGRVEDPQSGCKRVRLVRARVMEGVWRVTAIRGGQVCIGNWVWLKSWVRT